jgi:hypothetical protein
MKAELLLIGRTVVFATGLALITPDSTLIGTRPFFFVLATTAIFYVFMRFRTKSST